MKELFVNSRGETMKQVQKREIIILSQELGGEIFLFPGLDPSQYQKLKATDEKYPGFVTPIDELLKRFEEEGMKVVFGDHPASANVFVLPSRSTDIESDSISPQDLQINGRMSEKLKKLIEILRSQM